MRMIQRSVAGWSILCALLASIACKAHGAGPDPSNAPGRPHLPLSGCVKEYPSDSSLLSLRAEYGTSLAFAGRTTAAESVFVSMLSVNPKDPRALTDLGNLSLLRGELRAAAVFYEEASRQDQADPGIRLDLAVALMLQGKQAEAAREAAAVLPAAGGAAGALDLFGIRASLPEVQEDKAGAAPLLDENELRDLLEAAAQAIPIDSTSAADSVGTAQADSIRTAQGAGPGESLGGKRGSSAHPDSAAAHEKEEIHSRTGRSWKSMSHRPAGSRASEDRATWRVLYWKH